MHRPAHHPFADEFNRSKPVTLTGTVSKVEWTNPHVYAYINVKDDPSKGTWKVEMGSPAALAKEVSCSSFELPAHRS